MRRFACLGVVVAILAAGAQLIGQSTTGQPPPAAAKPPAAAEKKAPEQAPAATAERGEAAREVPAERKAYNEATKISDPDKKIEALKKVIEDFPKTSVVESANYAIFTTLLGKMKETGKKVIEQAKVVAEAERESARGSESTRVASALLAQDLLLEDALTFAQKGIDTLDEKKFAEGMRKTFADTAAEAAKRDPTAKPMEPPDDAELAKMFVGSKQSAYSALGQIYARLGRHAEAEKALRETYLLDPKAGAAATAAVKLADYAAKAGRDAEQLEYLTVAALAGRLTAQAKADLDAVYKKTHDGSLDGLEEMLDRRYEKDNPLPVRPKPYVAGPGRSDRVVLAEIFTGSGCPPCVGADLAFEAALARYQPKDFAVLMYHLHIPRPDPMTNPSTLEREKLYGVRGVPSFYIDGQSDGRGGGDAASSPRIYNDRVEPAIEKRLKVKAEARVDLKAATTPAGVQVQASVSGVKSTAKKLKLQVLLVEERVRYSGENGVRFHPMVVRSIAGEAGGQGFPVTAGKSLKIEHTFDLEQVVASARDHLDDFEKTSTRFPNHKFLEKKHAIGAGALWVVAFVQDEDSKAILQASQVKLGRP